MGRRAGPMEPEAAGAESARVAGWAALAGCAADVVAGAESARVVG